MRLLVDTDAFCKIGAADLLGPSAEVLGATLVDCARLPALPHMLRRGSLRRRVGDAKCDALLPLALRLPEIPQPPASWLDILATLADVDAGEAQLLACAAELDVLLMSGDKRALRAVKGVAELRKALHGKVVLVESVLLALCLRDGDETVRRAVLPCLTMDTMISVAFSPGNASPRDALRAYLSASIEALAPLIVWAPPAGVVP